MTFNDMTLNVKENQSYDWLVETGLGYNSEVF